MAFILPTVEAVRAIVKTSLDDAQVQVMIDDAALLVGGCITSLDAARQTSIIKYATAHLIASTGQGGSAALLTSKRLGDASESYARPSGNSEGLASTAFGRNAINLDTTGCLGKMGQSGVLFKVL